MNTRTLQDSERYANIGETARDWLVVHLNERAHANPDTPAATLDREASALGEIELLNRSSRCLIRSLAQRIAEQGSASTLEPGLVRTLVVRNTLQIVDIALKLAGEAGLANGSPLLRLQREALLARVQAPTPDSVAVAAGRQALGIVTTG